MPPTPLDVLVPTIPYHPHWPYSRTRAYTVPYLAWDDKTVREAVIVLPSGWGPAHHPRPLPLVISPHGRNNFGWGNAAHYSAGPTRRRPVRARLPGRAQPRP